MLTRYNYTLINYSGVGLPDYLPSAISSADAKTLTWNSEGRLSRVKLGNRLNVDMTYDASGLRTSKTYNNVVHEYTYDDGRLITEKIGRLTMVFLYDESNNVDCIWYNGDKYYLIRNSFGDVVQLRDESNQVVAYYKYNAFGYLLSVTDANGAEITDTSHIAHLNPIRYRGYYYDTELKMYYLYSRYYNPEMCRFISADSLLGTSLAGTNLFAYCGNDPVNYIDPYGYCGACIPGVYYAGKAISCDLDRDRYLAWVEREKEREEHSDDFQFVLPSEEDGAEIVVGAGSDAFQMAVEPTNPQLGSAMENAGTAVTVVTTAVDLHDTFTEDNDNSFYERLFKAGVQLAGTGASLALSSATAAAVNYWNPSGLVAAGVAVLSFGVMIAGNIIITGAQEGIYEYYGIE